MECFRGLWHVSIICSSIRVIQEELTFCASGFGATFGLYAQFIYFNPSLFV